MNIEAKTMPIDQVVYIFIVNNGQPDNPYGDKGAVLIFHPYRQASDVWMIP